MPATATTPHPFGRRLAGSMLYALLVSAVALPVMNAVAGLVVGPQALREKIFVTSSQFAAYHGRAGLFLVMLATVALFTLGNLIIGPRKRYAWNWGLGPQLFDDGLSAREKLALVLKSWWGRLLLVLDLGWIAFAAFEPV